jgi:hypothetical protein
MKLPSFLQKLDKYLLLNYPTIWSSRIHLSLFFSSIIAVTLYILFLLINKDARANSSEFTSTSLLTILIIIALVVYCIYLLRFNVFKRFGVWKKLDSLLVFFFSFLSACSIIFWAFIPSISSFNMANKKYNFNELIADQNKINQSMALLHADSLNLEISYDQTIFLDTIKKNEMELADNQEVMTSVATTATIENDNNPLARNRNSIGDTATFNQMLLAADSLVKLSDTCFEIYKMPELQFSDVYISNGYGKTITNKELYYFTIANMQNANKESLLKQIKLVGDKYITPSQLENSKIQSAQYAEVNDKNVNGVKFTKAHFMYRHQIDLIQNSIRNISDRKNYWLSTHKKQRLHIWFYLSLVLGVLVFIFRHSNNKTFFLSILTGGLLCIISAPILIFVASDELGAFSLLLFYFFIFLIIACSIFASKSRSLVQGIALNLAVAITYFIPMVLVGLNYAIKKNVSNNNTYSYENESMNMYYSQFIGFALLLISIQFLYSKLYKKWFALPEA